MIFPLRKALLLISSLVLLVCALFYIDGTSGLSEAFKLFSPGLLSLVVVLYLFTVLLSFFRIWVVLHDFGYKLSFLDVAKACAAGNIGSLFFIPVLGQIAGRQFYLSKLGVTAIENSAVSGYERIVAAFVSGLFAAFGFLYLYGWGFVEGQDWRKLYLFGVPVVVALFVFHLKIFSAKEKEVLRGYFKVNSLFLFARVFLVVAVGMLLMMLCFAFMFRVALPSAGLSELISIAFIVSFLASLPVSFGGWGLREVSSMFFIASYGGDPQVGLAASVLIGFISMAVVLAFYPLLVIGRRA